MLTPVNNSVFDLFNQIRLVTRDHDDFFAAAGIRSLWGYFLQVEANKDHLYDLLEEIAVRRSRHYIRKNYPHAIIDGKPVRFPERTLHTVRYSLEQTYDGLYQELAERFSSLKRKRRQAHHRSHQARANSFLRRPKGGLCFLNTI